MKIKLFISFVFISAMLALFLLALGIIFMDAFLFPAVHTGKKTGNMTLLSNGVELDVFYKKAPFPRGVVLYSHGNKEFLSKIQPWLDEFVENNYTILAYDYAGYGGSGGKAGTRQAISDIEAAYKFLTEKENVSPSSIIAVGYSVGSGPSTYLACKYPIRKLALIGPFASASEAALPFDVPFNRFRNAELLSKNKVEVVLFHGTADKIVPYRNSQKIYQQTIGKKTLKTYEGADHRNIFQHFKKDFWQELAK